MDIQVPESRTEKLGNVSALPRHRSGFLDPFVSTFRSRRKTAALLGALVLASIAILYGLDPWRKWGGRSGASNRDHWRQAQQAIEDRDFPLAQTHLTHCLEASPLNAEAHFLMARVCRRADDFAGWLDHLQDAAVLGWPQDEVKLELLLKEAQVGNTWKVEQELQSYLASGHPEQVLIVEALVKGYLENDLPKKAHYLTEEWIANFPDDWLARFYHGRACQIGVRFEEAIADFKKVLELKPDQAETQLWLAKTYLSYTEFEVAMKYYQAYLESHPGDADALFGLAKCQFTHQGDGPSARATLEELLSEHPYHFAGLYLRAQLEQAEAPEKALPWLRRALAIAPYEPNILHNLVLALRALHQDKDADQFQEREKVSRQKANELIDLQRQLVQGGDKVNEADLRYQVAVLHLELGHEEKETAHWFQTVLYLDPDHRPTLRALADYWEKHDDPRRAAYYRDRAEGKRPAAPSSSGSSR
jgi:tetratricopeptide (TPR) repeat protein